MILYYNGTIFFSARVQWTHIRWMVFGPFFLSVRSVCGNPRAVELTTISIYLFLFFNTGVHFSFYVLRLIVTVLLPDRPTTTTVPAGRCILISYRYLLLGFRCICNVYPERLTRCFQRYKICLKYIIFW